jgi:hypothetical protein
MFADKNLQEEAEQAEKKIQSIKWPIQNATAKKYSLHSVPSASSCKIRGNPSDPRSSAAY